MATNFDRCFIGDDFVIHFPEARDATGAIVDLTGATLYCSIQLSTGGAKTAASGTSIDSPATAGKCRATFDAAVTAALTADAHYKYDGVVKLASGERHTVGTGSFKAVTRITPQPA